MTGYDSAEVKALVEAEAPLREFIEAMEQSAKMFRAWIERHEMAETHAVCSVCEVPLAPLSQDENHHVCTLSDYHNEHFCSAHCPACSKGDDDGPEHE